MQTRLQNIIQLFNEIPDEVDDERFILGNAIEIIFTLRQLRHILKQLKNHSENLTQEILTGVFLQFKHFFESRWERIQGTDLAYIHSTHLPITQFCIAVADLISDHLKLSRYKLLMPTLDEKSFDVTNVESTGESLSRNALQCHEFILSDDHRQPIFVLACLDSSIEDGILKHTTVYEGKAETLTQEEAYRVVNHSEEAYKYYQLIYEIVHYKNEGTSVGSAIQRLINRLRQGGEHGDAKNKLERKGQEYNSGADANEGIAEFDKFWQILTGYDLCEMTDDIKPEAGKLYVREHKNDLAYTVIAPTGILVKDIIFKNDQIVVPKPFCINKLRPLLTEILKISTLNGHTILDGEKQKIAACKADELTNDFNKCWGILTRPNDEEYKEETPCVELIAGNLEQILNANEHLFSLFPTNKEAGIKLDLEILESEKDEAHQDLIQVLARKDYYVSSRYGSDGTKLLFDCVSNFNEEKLSYGPFYIKEVSEYLNDIKAAIQSVSKDQFNNLWSLLNHIFRLDIINLAKLHLNVISPYLESYDYLLEPFVKWEGGYAKFYLGYGINIVDILTWITEEQIRIHYLKFLYASGQLNNAIMTAKSLALVINLLPDQNIPELLDLFEPLDLQELISNINKFIFSFSNNLLRKKLSIVLRYYNINNLIVLIAGENVSRQMFFNTLNDDDCRTALMQFMEMTIHKKLDDQKKELKEHKNECDLYSHLNLFKWLTVLPQNVRLQFLMTYTPQQLWSYSSNLPAIFLHLGEDSDDRINLLEFLILNNDFAENVNRYFEIKKSIINCSKYHKVMHELMHDLFTEIFSEDQCFKFAKLSITNLNTDFLEIILLNLNSESFLEYIKLLTAHSSLIEKNSLFVPQLNSKIINLAFEIVYHQEETKQDKPIKTAIDTSFLNDTQQLEFLNIIKSSKAILRLSFDKFILIYGLISSKTRSIWLDMFLNQSASKRWIMYKIFSNEHFDSLAPSVQLELIIYAFNYAANSGEEGKALDSISKILIPNQMNLEHKEETALSNQQSQYNQEFCKHLKLIYISWYQLFRHSEINQDTLAHLFLFAFLGDHKFEINSLSNLPKRNKIFIPELIDKMQLDPKNPAKYFLLLKCILTLYIKQLSEDRIYCEKTNFENMPVIPVIVQYSPPRKVQQPIPPSKANLSKAIHYSHSFFSKLNKCIHAAKLLRDVLYEKASVASLEPYKDALATNELGMIYNCFKKFQTDCKDSDYSKCFKTTR